MLTAKPIAGHRLGSIDTMRNKPYAHYWQPNIAPLPANTVEALNRGCVAHPLMPGLIDAKHDLTLKNNVIEEGYSFAPDGAMFVSSYTFFPQATPAMLDWWFSWHNEEPERYQLWHPQAHVHAAWQNANVPVLDTLRPYIGKTSIVDEYVGSQLGRYAITFLDPQSIGLQNNERETFIFARAGFAQFPINAGYLLHQFRQIEGGCEMRSRFWLGGQYSSLRLNTPLHEWLMKIARKVIKPKEQEAREMLVHCAQEMGHLAKFLPAIYQELGESSANSIK